jgi:hypothetical protein
MPPCVSDAVAATLSTPTGGGLCAPGAPLPVPREAAVAVPL